MLRREAPRWSRRTGNHLGAVALRRSFWITQYMQSPVSPCPQRATSSLERRMLLDISSSSSIIRSACSSLTGASPCPTVIPPLRPTASNVFSLRHVRPTKLGRSCGIRPAPILLAVGPLTDQRVGGRRPGRCFGRWGADSDVMVVDTPEDGRVGQRDFEREDATAGRG